MKPLPSVLPTFHPPEITTASWMAVMPVLIVIIAGLLALTCEIVAPKRCNVLITVIGLLGVVAAAVACFDQLNADEGRHFAGMFTNDRFGNVMQLLMLLSCGLTLAFSEGYMRSKKIAFGEFYPLILWSTAGGMLMVSTQNLLMVFVGLEILSIALYVLAGLSRSESKSEESALKYFLLGAFASGFLLYGIALIYGASGSLDLSVIGRAFDPKVASLSGLMLMGCAFALVGFCFKSAFVPFHQWTPDVYQGAPTNVTAFMAAGSKIAAVAALFRFLEGCMPLRDYWIPALFWVAILTMTVGNLVALLQRDVKRILGYSSIAHAGYILVAILAYFKLYGEIGWSTLAYYLLSYVLMTIGAFAVLSTLSAKGKEGTRLQDLNGLWQRSPIAAVALVIFMASLIGVPPTAGFFAKLHIFKDAVTAGLLPLAIVLAVNSAISCYYYLGIALAAFVSDSSEAKPEPIRMGGGLAATTAICAAGVLAVALFFSPITNSMFGTSTENKVVVQNSTGPASK